MATYFLLTIVVIRCKLNASSASFEGNATNRSLCLSTGQLLQTRNTEPGGSTGNQKEEENPLLQNQVSLIIQIYV